MQKKKILIYILIILIGLLLGAGGIWFWKMKNNKPAEIASSAILAKEARKNYFEINDETAGVFFRISKNFDRMTAQELQLKNPVFMYGFFSRSDKSSYCVISQTKREKPGGMRAVDLRDGVLEQVKKSFPDAVLEAEGIMEIGEKNNKGIRLTINYTDNNVPVTQQEVVGITDKMATFAFCVAPKAVIDLCQDDFGLFLDNIRIK